MEIREIKSTDEIGLTLSTNLNLFAQNYWTSIFDQEVLLYGIFKGAELLALFHTFQYSKFGKAFLISTPMAPNCGFQLLRSAEGKYASQTETKRILRTMAEFLAEKAKNTYVDIALPVGITDVQPFIWNELSVTPKYTYLLDCTLHESALLANMSTERRKNIRDAAKAGYEIQINQNPDAAIALVNDTLRRAGETPKETELKRILHPENNPWRFWVLISRGGEPLATAIVGYDTHRAYYLAGGHNHAAGDSLAGTWALWNGIIETGKRSVPSFDFLGSSVPSIEQYFRGFGGTLTPYFRIGGGQGFTGFLKSLKKKLAK
jgi:hypothetical protein